MCPTAISGDATAAIIAQIERFAPGFRDRIVGHTVRTTTQMAAYNPNYVGGDIMTGSKDIRQLTFGPRITLSPVSTLACPACTSVRRPPRRARALTACAVPTPPNPRYTSSANGDRS